ncbi:NAD(P)H-binding protein [Streptomyces sp. NPDC004044]
MTGGVGSRLAARLIEQGEQIVGLHSPYRAGAHPGIRRNRAGSRQPDVAHVDTPTARLEGADAVAFTAGASGAGPRQADAVDGQGVKNGATAAAKAGVHRFLLVSAFPCPAALPDTCPCVVGEH